METNIQDRTKQSFIFFLSSNDISLLLFHIVFATGNAKVSQLVSVLAGGNDAKVVSQLLLLEVPLAKILELSLGESKIGGGSNGELGAIAGDGNIVRGKVSSLTIHLDTVLKVLLERGNVENFIFDGGCAVDDELYRGFLGLWCL